MLDLGLVPLVRKVNRGLIPRRGRIFTSPSDRGPQQYIRCKGPGMLRTTSTERRAAGGDRPRGGCIMRPAEAGRIQDWSADSRVRAFLASDQVRADKAVRAPISTFLESALQTPGARLIFCAAVLFNPKGMVSSSPGLSRSIGTTLGH